MKFIYILLYNMGNVQFKVPKIKDNIEYLESTKLILNIPILFFFFFSIIII